MSYSYKTYSLHLDDVNGRIKYSICLYHVFHKEVIYHQLKVAKQI